MIYKREVLTLELLKEYSLVDKMVDDYIDLKLPEGSVKTLKIDSKNSNIKYEILNFIYGKNSVFDIRNAVSAEYEPVPVEWVKECIDLLAKAGILR